MKKIQILFLITLPLAGCASSETPQASAQIAKQFKGGPMPPDIAKQFQQSRQKATNSCNKSPREGGTAKTT
jgi:hypothetical protein